MLPALFAALAVFGGAGALAAARLLHPPALARVAATLAAVALGTAAAALALTR